MFRATILPILRSTRLCLQLVMCQHSWCIIPQAVNTV